MVSWGAVVITLWGLLVVVYGFPSGGGLLGRYRLHHYHPSHCLSGGGHSVQRQTRVHTASTKLLRPSVYSWSPFISGVNSLSMCGDEVCNDDERISLDNNGVVELSRKLPSKPLFYKYFASVVSPSGEPKGRGYGVMTLEQLCNYTCVKQLLSDGLVNLDDIKYLSVDFTPVKAVASFDRMSAYELLCAIIDLPDPELIEFLNDSYLDMCTEKNPSKGVSYDSFVDWEVLHEAYAEGCISRDRVDEIWLNVMKSKHAAADRRLFGILYGSVEDCIEAANVK
jgi:hypothetical protein